jgi:hypothetical protein
VRAAGRGDVVATDQDRIVICTLCRQGFAAVVRTRAPATVRTQGEGAHPEFLSAVRI